VLEKEFAKYPDHPGVAHYLIHSYDAPPIAKQGLSAARKYSTIAPDAPHALHMPSHIFTRVGAWQDSVATNARSADVALKGGEPDEAYHASDYAVYADLQLARDADARRVMEGALKVTGTNPARFTAPYAIAAMPARYAVERNAWADAVQSLKRAEVRLPENADLQNHLGYAYRNLAQYDAAFRHYKRALTLDPRHRGAHEYIGEAYLMVDDVANAERHLVALREICLLQCEELADLEKAFAAYAARKTAR
jgi:tetratricopeptide (TPR) repeat protein